MTKSLVNHQPALTSEKLAVIDTTGAGDAFTAAFAVTRDVKLATGAAFLTCTVKGAAESIPTLDQVKQTFGF